jgi:transcriptional regulator NrdR family protein
MPNKNTIDLIGCVKCGATKTLVTDSRPVFKHNIHYTRRKRTCVKCNEIYWTKEVMDYPMRVGRPTIKANDNQNSI